MERDISTRLRNYLLDMQEITSLSNDPNTKVGCLILSKDWRTLSYGYNDAPMNWKGTFPWDDRKEKYKYVIHAEINAVASLTQTPYYAIVTLFPCSNCVKALIAAGVKEIYYKDIRMNDDANVVFTLCHMCGVKLIQIV